MPTAVHAGMSEYDATANARAVDLCCGIRALSGAARDMGMAHRRLHPVRSANTRFSVHRSPPAHFAEPRSITVREAARLQGFPDTFRVYGSFANQMEQVTSAVLPPLARAVLCVLFKSSGLLRSYAAQHDEWSGPEVVFLSEG